jgi:DNA-binding NtrC family response regulator
MNSKNPFSSTDRQFFQLVSQAAFCNPFSERRVQLDCQIAECSQTVQPRVRIEMAVQRIIQKVDQLEREGKADIGLFSGELRRLMESVFMFEIYHQFSKKFDQVIHRQINEGATPCQVNFSKDTIGMLRKRGFSVSESVRLFAMIYQMKRAYFFIEQGLIGESPCMGKLRLNLWNNVFTHNIQLYGDTLWNRMEDFSTLLLGETGVGKGAAASAIGRSGFIPFDPQKDCFKESFVQSFISINLSQYPESLIESELFGHKKGAFTGAVETHRGILSQCSPHGAIFIDEIGDVSIQVQVKLLQVLENRIFSPVGSHEKLRFSGRIIGATNKRLDDLRQKGRFRDDFYYRLCSDCIVVPSLRQRIQENPRELDLMLSHVIKRLTGEHSNELFGMVREVIYNKLGLHYEWPGNVRELEQAVRRILLSREYTPEHKGLVTGAKDWLFSGIEKGSLNAQELMSFYCTVLYERFGTYEEVSRRINLDRRTVKRYIEMRSEE